MRHYEVVFLVHPDQSDQAAAMADRYRSMIEASGGVIHRLEDWGRRLLAYPIDKIHKAHYVLMNFECENDALKELTSAFKFNDAVLRHLVIKRTNKISEPSVIFQSKEEQTGREDDRRRNGKPEVDDNISAPNSDKGNDVSVEKAPEAVEKEYSAEESKGESSDG